MRVNDPNQKPCRLAPPEALLVDALASILIEASAFDRAEAHCRRDAALYPDRGRLAPHPPTTSPTALGRVNVTADYRMQVKGGLRPDHASRHRVACH